MDPTNLNLQHPTSPNSPKENEERIDLQQHSGKIWDCIGRKPCDYGGRIYEFIAKEHFDDFSINPKILDRMYSAIHKNDYIFPAQERSPAALWALCDDSKVKKIMLKTHVLREAVNLTQEFRYYTFKTAYEVKLAEYQKNFKRVHRGYKDEWESLEDTRSLLQEIGYHVSLDEEGRLHVKVPDLDALNNGWKLFQQNHFKEYYPGLDVIGSEGIADDHAFFTAHLHHDFLLSNGEEFMHDHLAHILPGVINILDDKKKYSVHKKRVMGLIQNIQKAIDEAERLEEEGGVIHREKAKLNFIPGMLTDLNSAKPLDELRKITQKNLEEIFIYEPYENRYSPWDDTIRRKFGPNTNFKAITKLWSEVKKLVPREPAPEAEKKE